MFSFSYSLSSHKMICNCWNSYWWSIDIGRTPRGSVVTKPIGSMRTRVSSLASISGLRILCFAVSCSIGDRRSSDPLLLWLWHRLAAKAQIHPLAWELQYALGVAVKKPKKKKKKVLILVFIFFSFRTCKLAGACEACWYPLSHSALCSHLHSAVMQSRLTSSTDLSPA